MTTRGVAESAMPAMTATSASASGTAIPLRKRQKSATDVEVPLANSFDYRISKLFKFKYTYDKVNTPLEKHIKTIAEEDNTNTKSIMHNMLATITGLYYTLFQAHLNMQA